MRYELTAEQEDWRREIRAFLRAEVTPALEEEMRVSGNEGRGPLALEFQRKLGARGYWGVGWPKNFGGLGKTAVEQYILIEEMDLAGAPGMQLSVTSVAPTIMRVGTPAQQAHWLPRIMRGEVDFALGYSEAGAGTDLASLESRAVLNGDEWVINGTKMWNTGAHMATHNWLAVRTEPEAPKHQGISLMIVPMDRPGITVQPLWTWPGLRTNALFLDNVRVPRDHLVGERGQGFYYVMMALDFERIAIGSVGMLRRFYDGLVAFVRSARRDGRPLARVPWVRQRMAEMARDLEVGRMLGLLNAWLIDQGVVPTKEGSMVKIFVSELAARLSSVGMDILGLAGQLAPENPVAPLHGRLQWMYKTAPLLRFGGGSNEIQRLIIAQRGLGLPRK
jgi:alkylation response protein AidB-like acyl-CoA dehydrogenase